MYRSNVRFNFLGGAIILLGLIFFFTPFIKFSAVGVSESLSGMKLMINSGDAEIINNWLNIWLLLALISGGAACFILFDDDFEIAAIITSLISVIFLIVFRTTFMEYYEIETTLRASGILLFMDLDEIVKTSWGYICSLICMIAGVLLSIANWYTVNQESSHSNYTSNYASNSSSPLTQMAREATIKKQNEEGYWKCLCGRLNPPYSSGCECGLTVSEVKRIKSENSKKAFEQSQLEKKEAEKAEIEKKAAESVSNEKDNISLLKEYKELLDSGIISQEDFDKKKSELLKL